MIFPFLQNIAVGKNKNPRKKLNEVSAVDRVFVSLIFQSSWNHVRVHWKFQIAPTHSKNTVSGENYFQWEI